MPFLNKWFKVSLPAITATGTTLATVLLITLRQEDNSKLLNIQDEELKDLELKSELFKDKVLKEEKQKEVESLEELTKKLDDAQNLVDSLSKAKGDSLEKGNSQAGAMNEENLSNLSEKEIPKKSLENSNKESSPVGKEEKGANSQDHLTEKNEKDLASENNKGRKEVPSTNNLNIEEASLAKKGDKDSEKSESKKSESLSKEPVQEESKGPSDLMGGGAGSNVGTAPEGKGKWTDKELKDLTEILENSFDISLQLQVVTER